MKRVGSCSLCGGDVFGVRGIWMSVNPPPPDQCRQCGAVSRSDVIEMINPNRDWRLRNQRWKKISASR